MSNQINVFDLHRLALARRQKERECFMSVLERCYSRIRRINKMYRSQCEFDVPIMVAGRPLFDLETCIKFMIRNLSGNGFVVHFYPPRTLHISWGIFAARKGNNDHQNEERNTTNNAIAAAPSAAHQAASRGLPSTASPPLTSKKIREGAAAATAESSGAKSSDTQLSRVYEDDRKSATTTRGTSCKQHGGGGDERRQKKKEQHRQVQQRHRTDNKPSQQQQQTYGEEEFQFLDLPRATRTTDIGNKSEEGAASKNMESVLEAYEHERKKQDEDLRRLVPRPKSQAHFYRSISEFRPSGRFSVTPALASLQEQARRQ